MAPVSDIPQKNLESAIKLYDELQQVTKKAGKEAEFLQLSLQLKIKKEVLDSVNNDLKTLYNQVVDQTQSNNVVDNTPAASTIGNSSDSKFTNTIGNGKTYRKAAKIADRQEQKLENIDKYIKRKLDIDGIGGLVAAVNQLSQEVRSQYPELFKDKFDSKRYEQNKELGSQQPQTTEQVAAKYAPALEKSKNPESLIGLISKDIDSIAKKTLIDKAGWSQGAVDIAKVFGGLYLGFKALGAANDAFPDGLEGFMLKLIAGYSAYAGYDKYKDDILNGYKRITKQEETKNTINKDESLSHRALESKGFKDGEAWFKGITNRFRESSSTALSSYITADGLNLGQLVADYSGKEVTYLKPEPYKPNVDKTKLLHDQMEFDSTKSFDLIAQIHAAIEAGNAKQIYGAPINQYIAELGIDPSKDTTIQSYNEKFVAYETIQKVRYHILKRAGYELDLTQGDKRKEIDDTIKGATGKEIKGLSIDYKLSDDEKTKLKPLIDTLILMPVQIENADISKKDAEVIDTLLGKKLIVLENNEPSTILKFKKAFAREDAKHQGKMKFAGLKIGNQQQITIDIEGVGQFPVTITPSGMSLGFADNIEQQYVPKAVRTLEFTDSDKFFEAVGYMITKIMPLKGHSKINPLDDLEKGKTTINYFNTGSIGGLKGLTFRADYGTSQSTWIDQEVISQSKIKELFPSVEKQSSFVDWLNSDFVVDGLPIWDIKSEIPNYFYSGSKSPKTSISSVDRDQTIGDKVKISLQDGVDYTLDIMGIIGSGAKKGLVEALEGTGDIGKKIVRELGEIMGVGIMELNKLVPQGFKVIEGVVDGLGKTFSKMSDESVNGFMGGLGRLLNSGVITAGSTSEEIMRQLGAVSGVGMDEIKQVFADHGLHKGGWALIGHLVSGIIAYRFTKYGIKQSAGE